jgi:hypothetical protein
MKSFFNTVLFALFISCSKQASEKTQKFSSEQIASLNLDSTKAIQLQIDSILHIDLNPFLEEANIDFADMIKSIAFTPLETNDESLISEITDILVTDSNIYVHDSYQGGSVLIFDKEGRYLKRIEKGQGPEEILNLKNIVFDNDKKELIVYHYKILSFFTPDGQFKRRERIPFNARSVATIPDGYIFKVSNGTDNRHLGVLNENQILITDKNFMLRSTGFPYLYSKDNNYENERYINIYDKYINFTFKLTDTVYQYINDKTVKAKYAIDIHDKEIPVRIKKELSAEDFFTEIRQNNYYFFMGEYIENSKHDFLILENWHVRNYIFIFRDKGSGNIKAGTVLKNSPAVFPVIREPVASKDSYFISYFIPEHIDELKKLLPQSLMLSEEDKIKIENLQEEDNPVLIFYKLKSF